MAVENNKAGVTSGTFALDKNVQTQLLSLSNEYNVASRKKQETASKLKGVTIFGPSSNNWFKQKITSHS